MSENPVLKDATRARSILAADCGSVLTRKIVVALLLLVCIAGCHRSAPTEQRERNTAVSSATLRVQSLPQYREAEAACQRKEFRKAAQLLEKLPKTVSLTPEETAFCEQQRKICLRDAGLLPLEPPITTPPRLPSNVNCGAFALLKACERLGVPSTLESVRRLAGTNEKGTTLKGLSKAAKAAGQCFAAGTLVELADGTSKPIEQVKAGDWVASRDAERVEKSRSKLKSSENVGKRVVRTFVTEQKSTVEVALASGETIQCTTGHLFFVEGKGFVPAARLAIGNAIVTRAGPSVKVRKVEQSGTATVYNFEVEGTHTYFVGKTAAWVHNAGLCDLPDPYAGDPFPGVSPRQGLHDPTSPMYNPAKTPLHPGELPHGKAIEDVLRDAWNNPVPGGSVNPHNGSFIGEPGYPVNAQGSTGINMRLGKRGVHGWPTN